MALHNARGLIRDHDLLIVDGREGVVIVNPDESVLAEYRLRQNQWRIDTDKLKRLQDQPIGNAGWHGDRTAWPTSNC